MLQNIVVIHIIIHISVNCHILTYYTYCMLHALAEIHVLYENMVYF